MNAGTDRDLQRHRIDLASRHVGVRLFRMFTAIEMVLFIPVVLIGLLGACSRADPPSRRSIAAIPAPEQPVAFVRPEPRVLPGQRGPTPDLLREGEIRLTTHRTDQRFQDGNRIWKVEIHQGDDLLASWDAASGISSRQNADRLWSPGNAAPLPAGVYSLGLPEPWGDDLWFDLTPRFNTTRSALGIHRCYPGTGCICFPSRADIDALAAWVRRGNLRQVTVLN